MGVGDVGLLHLGKDLRRVLWVKLEDRADHEGREGTEVEEADENFWPSSPLVVEHLRGGREFRGDAG